MAEAVARRAGWDALFDVDGFTRLHSVPVAGCHPVHPDPATDFTVAGAFVFKGVRGGEPVPFPLDNPFAERGPCIGTLLSP